MAKIDFKSNKMKNLMKMLKLFISSESLFLQINSGKNQFVLKTEIKVRKVYVKDI